MSQYNDLIINEINNSCSVISKLVKQQLNIYHIANSLSNVIIKGGKLIFCGNGGSAADAQHLTAELIVRLRDNLNRRALPAISLGLDMSTITACSNDYSFDQVYSRELEALGNPSDALIIISTSGESSNIINVAKLARKKDIRVYGFLGKSGGQALSLCNDYLLVDSYETGHIQEAHICAGHIIIRLIEEDLINKTFI